MRTWLVLTMAFAGSLARGESYCFPPQHPSNEAEFKQCEALCNGFPEESLEFADCRSRLYSLRRLMDVLYAEEQQALNTATNKADAYRAPIAETDSRSGMTLVQCHAIREACAKPCVGQGNWECTRRCDDQYTDCAGRVALPAGGLTAAAPDGWVIDFDDNNPRNR